MHPDGKLRRVWRAAFAFTESITAPGPAPLRSTKYERSLAGSGLRYTISARPVVIEELEEDEGKSMGDIIPSTETPPEPVTQLSPPKTSDSAASGTESKFRALHRDFKFQISDSPPTSLTRCSRSFCWPWTGACSWTGSDG